jgi:hypothetical protein
VSGIKQAVTGLLKPEPEIVKPPASEPGKPKRTLGDIFVALEAQKVYNPQLPSVQKPEAPPANTFGKGTAPAMDTEGAWGQPKKK